MPRSLGRLGWTWVGNDVAFNEAVRDAQESIADNLEAAAFKTCP